MSGYLYANLFKKAILVVLVAIFASGLGVGIYANKGGPSAVELRPLSLGPQEPQEAVAEAAPVDTAAKYDVVVYAGTPEGVAAAVSSSRHGLKVALVSEKGSLGGVWANAQLNQMDNTYMTTTLATTDSATSTAYTLTNQGINEGFMKLLGIARWQNGFYDGVFDVDKVKPAFLNVLRDNKIDFLEFEQFDIEVSDRRIRSLTVAAGSESKKLRAGYFVDASENGDLAARAGCPYTLGRGQNIYGATDRPVSLPSGDYGPDELQMSATLMFKLGGVRWDYLSNTEHNGRSDRMARSGNAAWGYNLIAPQFDDPQALANGVMLRGLNLGKQSDGTVLVNGLLVFGVNGTVWGSVNHGVERGRAQLPAVVKYLQTISPAFKDAYLIDSPDTLYVRESRHFIGEYTLTLDDQMRGEMPYDTIALGNHAVDIHPYTPEEALQNLSAYGSLVDAHLVPRLYGVPLRSLLPQRVDNIALVGKTISSTPKAAGSARVLSIGISEAQAVGSIIKLAEQQDRTLKEIAFDSGFWATNVVGYP